MPRPLVRPALIATALSAVTALAACTGLPGPFARPGTTAPSPVTAPTVSTPEPTPTPTAAATEPDPSPAPPATLGPASTAPASPAPAPMTASPRPSGTVLDVTGYGALKVGMPLKDAERAGLIADNGYECDSWSTSDELARKGLQIGSDGKSVTEVTLAKTFKGEPGRTRSGAHVGMTFAQVRAIYGGDFKIETKNGNGGPFQAGVVRAGAREMMFIPDYGDGSWQRPLTDAMKVGSITARDHTADAYGGC